MWLLLSETLDLTMVSPILISFTPMLIALLGSIDSPFSNLSSVPHPAQQLLNVKRLLYFVLIMISGLVEGGNGG
jgi:hypothetical protein